MDRTDLRALTEMVRERTDIVEIIGQYLALDRTNKAICPYHADREPSFSVNPTGQYFKCFGCGVGGDVFTFLQLQEGLSFMQVLAELGLIVKKEGGVVADYFREGGVTFPILRHGRCVGITCRSLCDRGPKYRHLRGEISHLYNEDAVHGILVIITEGVMDAISAEQAGHPCVATLGTSGFKAEYLPRFRNCKTIYVCFDGDQAGREGAVRSASEIGGRARIVTLPDGYDLNDYFREYSPEDFQHLLESAQDIVRYHLGQISPDKCKVDLRHALDPVLRVLATTDKAEAEAYLSYEIKPRFGLTRRDVDAYRELVEGYREANDEAARAAAGGSDAEVVYSALFDGLVDIVEHEGKPGFLIKAEDGLTIKEHVERDGTIHIPPPRDQMPWCLARGEEVLRHYQDEVEGTDTRKFENDVTPEMALPLKERLLAFRARHLGEPLPEVSKPANGRLGDILRPLLQVIRMVHPEREESFYRLVRRLEGERLIEKSTSLKADILRAVVSLQYRVERGALPVKAITEVINQDRLDRYMVSHQRVGRQLSAMGFEKARTSEGAAAILWNSGVIDRLMQKYGLSQPSETSVTSGSAVSRYDAFDDNDVPDVTDVCQEDH